MKLETRYSILILALASFTSTAWAQDSAGQHPFLVDKFNLGLGLYWPKQSITIRVDGSSPEEEIDFDEALNLEDYKTTPSLNFRWRFGEKWSLFGQMWRLENGGGAVLEEDVEWQDIVFEERTFVNGGLDTSVARVFFGRNFSTSERHEFGLGAGLHWMELDAYLEGQVLTSEGGSDFYRGNVEAAFPMPNIGGWYFYSWSPKWMVQARLDWLSASIGDYSGGLWNTQVGINWQAFRHFGIGLNYNAFVIDVDIDKTDWHGKADTTQHGPFLALTATW